MVQSRNKADNKLTLLQVLYSFIDLFLYIWLYLITFDSFLFSNLFGLCFEECSVEDYNSSQKLGKKKFFLLDGKLILRDKSTYQYMFHIYIQRTPHFSMWFHWFLLLRSYFNLSLSFLMIMLWYMLDETYQQKNRRQLNRLND